jgi:hypothetical protein
MPVVVEVANDRHLQTLIGNTTHDLRDRRRRRFVIHRDANDLTSRACEMCDLRRRTDHVGSIGIGH